jgi:hypothetical protein
MPTDEIVVNRNIIHKQDVNDLNNLKPYNTDFAYLVFAAFTNTYSNIPADTSNGIVICGGYDSNNYYQVAVCDKAKLFVRHRSFGNWTSWTEK